uniref:protein DENND6B isoform X3 n=1 Tax=Macaca mulatta TaxID=9544 RepID=UPI0010A2A741|nr:protein DENND6B isoform X3 [Macaca mulatta]
MDALLGTGPRRARGCLGAAGPRSSGRAARTPAAPWARFSAWLECVCVVTFDLELGQALELVYPNDFRLTDKEKSSICYLSFPDSHSGCLGDTQFSFRMRQCGGQRSPWHADDRHYNSRAPVALQREPAHYFGYVYFRQVKDRSVKRGYFQKSLVLVSRLPFVRLFQALLSLIAPEYFDKLAPCLEAVCSEIDQWPAPAPGQTLNLPVMGVVVQVRIPSRVDKSESSPPKQCDQENLLPAPMVLASVHELDLFRCFRPVLTHVQTLWELVLLGEPLLVLAPSPDVSSEMVLALTSCLQPLRFCCDFRPYFTIHDSEFKEFTTRTQAPPNVVLGVTNPFFIKTLQHWPHILRVGEPKMSGDLPKQVKLKKPSRLKTLDTKPGLSSRAQTPQPGPPTPAPLPGPNSRAQTPQPGPPTPAPLPGLSSRARTPSARPPDPCSSPRTQQQSPDPSARPPDPCSSPRTQQQSPDPSARPPTPAPLPGLSSRAGPLSPAPRPLLLSQDSAAEPGPLSPPPDPCSSPRTQQQSPDPSARPPDPCSSPRTQQQSPDPSARPPDPCSSPRTQQQSPDPSVRPPDPCSSPRTQQQSSDPRTLGEGAPSCLLQWVPVSGVGWVRFSGAAKGMGLQADETPTLAPLWGCRSVGGGPLKGGAPAVPSRQASTPRTQPTSTATRRCLNGCSRACRRSGHQMCRAPCCGGTSWSSPRASSSLWSTTWPASCPCRRASRPGRLPPRSGPSARRTSCVAWSMPGPSSPASSRATGWVSTGSALWPCLSVPRVSPGALPVNPHRRFFKSPHFDGWYRQRHKEMALKLEALHLEAICEANIETWMKDKSEVEVVDLVLKLREKLVRAQGHQLPVKEATLQRAQLYIETVIGSLPKDLQAVLCPP